MHECTRGSYPFRPSRSSAPVVSYKNDRTLIVPPHYGDVVTDPSPSRASQRALALLAQRDFVAQAERDPLRLGPDADVAAQLAVVRLLLDADVDQRVLAEHAFRVQVRRQEPALALQRRARRQAAHVGGRNHMVQERRHVCDGGVHRHLVLPLKLRPHVAEGDVGAGGGRDVVHDVDVHVAEHHHGAVAGGGGLVHDVAKDGTLQGPNLELLKEVCAATDAPVIASGGISSLADIQALVDLHSIGIEGAIVGKALYAGAFTIQEALNLVRK